MADQAQEDLSRELMLLLGLGVPPEKRRRTIRLRRLLWIRQFLRSDAAP
jgi:hypothetical protein